MLRREPLKAAFCLAIFALHVLNASSARAQTPPSSLHTEGSTTGPIVESPEAMEVTGTIQCFCGTCVNQTLHECTCGLAAMEREKVAAALASGQTPTAIIASYVAEHGPQVRIVPERKGLNLIGWAMPFAAALVGLLALLLVLLAWQRRGRRAFDATGRPGPGSRPPGEMEKRYRERLERELKEMER